MDPQLEKRLTDALSDTLSEWGVEPKIELTPIPLSGAWGYSTAVSYSIVTKLNTKLQDEQETLSKKKEEINNLKISKSKKKRKKKELEKQWNKIIEKEAQKIALLIKDKMDVPEEFQEVRAIKGYLNFYLDLNSFTKKLLTEVFDKENDFGRGSPQKERIMVEYSQPNTHKGFHVGHLRNAAIGNALVNILRFAGYDTVAANYFGDTGSHVAKCLWCYYKFHRNEQPTGFKGEWLGGIYAEAVKKLDDAEKFRQSVVDWMQSIIREDEDICEEFTSHVVRLMRADSSKIEDCAVLLRETYHQPWDPEQIDDALLIELREFLYMVLEREVENEKKPFVKEKLENYQTLAKDFYLWNYKKEVEGVLRLLETRKGKYYNLWLKTRQWSLEEFERIYNELGIKFDVLFYESEVEDEGKRIALSMKEDEIAIESEGALVVDLAEADLGVFLVLRRDGTALYSTKDLALAKVKFEKHGIDRSIYVVGSEQKMYFQQLFKTLEIWGFPQAQKCYHLSYERVRLPEGEMSSRRGDVILYRELKDAVFGLAFDQVKNAERTTGAHLAGISEEEKTEIAEDICVASLLYSLIRDNDKVIVFDPQESVNFHGDTGPYIQYACVRAERILEKANNNRVTSDLDSLKFENLKKDELDLIEDIAQFPEVMNKAAELYQPHILANYAYDLAKTFTRFYHNCPVLKAGTRAKMKARLALVNASRQTLKNSLHLLGISVPEKM